FPAGLAGDDWTDGRSDLDVPHRAVVAAEWSPVAEGAIRIGAIVHARSGAPFTARFRDGVDANADGDWTNDPAFVDASLPGMDVLLDEWDCLRSDAGRFAMRNACRAGWRYRLDLRAAVRPFTRGADDVTLRLDRVNVLGPAPGRI